VVVVLEQWGYNVAALAAGLGIGGLAFALAAQSTLANLFGFTMIVGDRPFGVGDHIRTSDIEGTVEHVGLRSTRIRQADQAMVTIPNGKVADSVILNLSRLKKRLIQFTLRLPNETSSVQMQSLLQTLREMLKARQTVDAASVMVHFTDFSAEGLDILVRCYVNVIDWAAFIQEKEAINLKIMEAVERLQGVRFK
jgi:MscS family membrane protein